MEEGARHGVEAGVDVSRRCGVLAAHEAGAELALGHEEVDVVGADEVLFC